MLFCITADWSGIGSTAGARRAIIIEDLTVFCVNIKISPEGILQEEMDNMRIWLDHQRFEPATFRQSRIGSGIVFYIYFAQEGQAAAFARAFGGTIVDASRSK
jgi:hypothetical protein